MKGSKESIHKLPIEEAEARRAFYRQSVTAVQSTSELLKAAGERQARDRQRKAEKRSLETEKESNDSKTYDKQRKAKKAFL